MPPYLTRIWLQIMHASRLLRYRAVQWNVLAGFVILWCAAILAPNEHVSSWDWTRLQLMAVLTTLSMFCFVSSRHLRIHVETRQARIIGASALFGLALVVSLTFGIGSTAIFSLGFSIVTLQAMQARRGNGPWLLIGLLALIIPFWVWAALDAWSGGLLLLIPIAALALIGDQHMREAATPSDDDPLSWRAHRLASWIAILAASTLVLILALLTNAGDGWAVFGALGAIGLIGLEVGFPRPERDPRRYSVLFADLAFAWIAFCWLVSL